MNEVMQNSWLRKRLEGMRTRCLNPKATGWKYYGGKGVKVCKEWLESPEAFISWALENGAKPELQIDRIDGAGDYSPENCRWVTRSYNMRNRPPKSEWNWSEASQARYQAKKDEDDADISAMMEEWANEPVFQTVGPDPRYLLAVAPFHRILSRWEKAEVFSRSYVYTYRREVFFDVLRASGWVDADFMGKRFLVRS